MILRDNSSRAQQAVGIFQATAVVLLLVVLSNFWYISQLDSGTFVNEDNASKGLLLAYQLLPLAELILLVTSFVLMIRWLRRAYWNLHAQNLRMEHSEGWAAGAWFVPFLNMYRPYSITKEIWRKTQLVAFERVTPHALLRAWWVVFLLHSVVGNVTRQMASHSTIVVQLQSTAWGNIFTAGIGVVGALLTIQVVKRIAGFEAQMALRLEVSRIGGAAPVPALELEEDQSDFEY